jgi:parvulin-like peptidyl-prolyl isomerase
LLAAPAKRAGVAGCSRGSGPVPSAGSRRGDSHVKAHKTLCIALAIAFAAAATTLARAQAPAPASDAQVLAVVNGDQITRGALVDRLLNVTHAGRDALNEMIGEALLTQEATRRTLTVTDQEVQDRINIIKQRLGGGENQAELFARYLEQQNVTESGLTYKVKIKLIAEKVLADKIKVTDDEVQTAYERRKGVFDQPEKVVLSWIKVKTEADAKAVTDRLAKGEAFADVAKDVSTDLVTRQAGGIAGEAVKDDLPDELKEAAFSTEVGKYSQPIKTKEGDYAILMVNRKTAAVKHDPQFVKEMIRMDLREMKLRAGWSELMGSLLKNSKIENKLGPVEP